MSIARQLHELQEIDLALKSSEQEQARIGGLLGESQEVARVKARLTTEENRRDELTREQHSLEWEVEGLSAKVAACEEKLFGGAIRNPKELANLQREDDDLKARRGQFEDRLLETMGQVEAVTASVSGDTAELGRLEAEWKDQQRELSAELAQHRTAHADLSGEREALAAQIDPGALQVYERLKAQKGTGVATVEQGTCRGCQISLPTTELQQVRSGGLVRCGSCGRILYLA